jgi:hypothetical protein
LADLAEVSRVVRDQVLDKPSFAFDDLGAQEVKNISPAGRGLPWHSVRKVRHRSHKRRSAQHERIRDLPGAPAS